MRFTLKGLVLKQVKLRESDRILTLMTPEQGVVSVSARGSMKPSSKLFSASGQFCYSEWSLKDGKGMYTALEASPIEVFFGLRESLESLSLAAYLAEILQILSPTGQEAVVLFRLALNCLHVLDKQGASPQTVKAVFELRALSESGFMPDVLACTDCAKYEGGTFFFDTRNGLLLCGECAAEKGVRPNISPSAVQALRHIVLCEDMRLFAFALKGESLAQLSILAEQYLLFHIEYPPKTLAFFKTL